ncbi:MAG: hypothetical protein KKE17_00425 [Proteobacteria bacterium]|nr:hypothetical protein [Pseudomonadota bacterium]MBU1708446.1 hypothetical protein [Pseudomonadota bacterium]
MELWDQFTKLFTYSDLVIPAAQMGIYVIIINILMLISYYRACFITSLSFSFYWLFFLNQKNFVSAEGELTGGIYFYLIITILFMVALLVSFLNQKE